MKAIINHRGIGQRGLDRVGKGRPHVHRDGFDFEPSAIIWQGCFNQFATGSLGALRHDIKEMPFVEIVERGEVVVSFDDALFINADMLDFRDVTLGRAAPDRALHDGMRTVQ